jgi:hypothetical protein
MKKCSLQGHWQVPLLALLVLQIFYPQILLTPLVASTYVSLSTAAYPKALGSKEFKSNQITLYYLKLRNYRHGETWRYKNERNFAYTHTFSTWQAQIIEEVWTSGLGKNRPLQNYTVLRVDDVIHVLFSFSFFYRKSVLKKLVHIIVIFLFFFFFFSENQC